MWASQMTPDRLVAAISRTTALITPLGNGNVSRALMKDPGMATRTIAVRVRARRS